MALSFKNRYIYIYIYITLVICVCVALFVLHILGSTTREGYITDIKIDIKQTLKINNIQYMQTNMQENDAFESYLQNNPLKNYAYTFRVKTSSKVFKRSDIYAIYPDFSGLQDKIRDIGFDTKTNQGRFIISQKLSQTTLDNVPYTLKLQQSLIVVVIQCCVFVLLVLCCLTNIRFYFMQYLNPLFVMDKAKIYSLDNFRLSYIRNLFDCKLYSCLFYCYVVIIALFIISHQMLASMVWDEWVYSSSLYDTFYSPYKFDGWFWQRGRHFVDILMTLCMRPFGDFLVSFGVEPLVAFHIVSSFFVLLFYMLFFIACTLLAWIINDKQDFKLIFTLISLFTLTLTQGIEYILVGAYIGTAGIALLAFLPAVYMFMYDKTIILHSNISLHCALSIVIAYCASFQTETTTLVIFGFCVFIWLYIVLEKAKCIQLDRSNKNPFLYYYLIVFAITIPIAFCLTMISGRGQWQLERIDGTTHLQNILQGISGLHSSIHWVLAFGVCFIVAMCIYIKRYKKLSKAYFMQIMLVCIGLIGIIGFCAIQVPNVWFEAVLIFCVCVVLLLRYKKHSNTLLSIASMFIIVSLIACLSLQVVRNYESCFAKRQLNESRQLISLFIQAAKEGKDEIVLNQNELHIYNLQNRIAKDADSWPNRYITRWMQYYGYTRNPITIRINTNPDSR